MGNNLDELSEVIADISMNVAWMINTNRIDVEDSRDIIDNIKLWAVEFQNPGKKKAAIFLNDLPFEAAASGEQKSRDIYNPTFWLFIQN